VHRNKEENKWRRTKSLAISGCSYCKALMLNLLTWALTSSYLASLEGGGNQEVSNLEEGVLVLARESLWSYSGDICGVIGG
jgi:hypothetical protein